MLLLRGIKSKDKTAGLQVLEAFFGGVGNDFCMLTGVGFENEIWNAEIGRLSEQFLDELETVVVCI